QQVMNELNEDERSLLRNQYVGFIFQNFQLLPTLTALENVMVPLELRNARNVKKVAMELLEKVGLAARSSHYPAQLSGGEHQRVSRVRAVSISSNNHLAYEPTGNLDSEPGENVEKWLFDLNREAGTTHMLVTHVLDLASKTQRVIHMKGGNLLTYEH